MDSSVRLAGAALALVGICHAGYSGTSIAQTSLASRAIATFEDVTGKWAGHANNHNVTLEIDVTGRFRARSGVGGESGEAKIRDGILLIPLVEHQGTLHLALEGDALTGTGVLHGKKWVVSLRRSGPAAQTD